MTGIRKDIATHKFHPEEKVFFDANVWLYILGPQAGPSDSIARTYSAAFKKIIEAKCTLYVDVLVLSEFANRYARIVYENNGGNIFYQNYKKFRDSTDFHDTAQALSEEVRRLLKFSFPIESNLSCIDVPDFTNRLEAGHCDFNDLMISALCQSKDLIFVTHDRDFNDDPVSILTANMRLLNF